MKKALILTVVIAAIFTSFNSCTTYEEGPGFTIIPAQMRIKGSWQQTALYINDDLQENSQLKLEFTFNGDGTGTRSTTLGILGTSTDTIEWKFNDDKSMVLVKKPSDSEWDDFKILRLTTKEMWLEEDTGLLGIWKIRYTKK